MGKHPLKKKVREAYQIGDTEAKAFYEAVGAALTQWARVEEALCQIYLSCVVPSETAPKAPAAASYWAIATFDGKLKMTSRALKIWLREMPELRGCWDRTYCKLRSVAKQRNALAHGTVVSALEENKDGKFKLNVRFVPSHYKDLHTRDHSVDYSEQAGALTLNAVRQRSLMFAMLESRARHFGLQLHDRLARLE
jgi:hypothetical protein